MGVFFAFAAMSDASVSPRPTSAQLFTGFLVLGMTSFGGVLPLARNMLVERRRWLTGEEFLELLSICQFLPGGNIMNLAVALGMKKRGWPGACAALLGLLLMPILVVVLLGMAYARFREDPLMQHAFAGLSAAAAGLLAAMVVKIARQLRGNGLGIAVSVTSFIVIAVLRLPLLYAMLGLAAVSTLLAWRARR
jgi:chromate transporter